MNILQFFIYRLLQGKGACPGGWLEMRERASHTKRSIAIRIVSRRPYFSSYFPKYNSSRLPADHARIYSKYQSAIARHTCVYPLKNLNLVDSGFF
jgi:hypothetical protein